MIGLVCLSLPAVMWPVAGRGRIYNIGIIDSVGGLFVKSKNVQFKGISDSVFKFSINT